MCRKFRTPNHPKLPHVLICQGYVKPLAASGITLLEITYFGRDGFRECGALGHLSFGGPKQCDLFGCLSEKRERMPLLCVAPPQKSIFIVLTLVLHLP